MFYRINYEFCRTVNKSALLIAMNLRHIAQIGKLMSFRLNIHFQFLQNIEILIRFCRIFFPFNLNLIQSISFDNHQIIKYFKL